MWAGKLRIYCSVHTAGALPLQRYIRSKIEYSVLTNQAPAHVHVQSKCACARLTRAIRGDYYVVPPHINTG